MVSFAEASRSLWKATVIAFVLCLVFSISEGFSEYKSKCYHIICTLCNNGLIKIAEK